MKSPSFQILIVLLAIVIATGYWYFNRPVNTDQPYVSSNPKAQSAELKEVPEHLKVYSGWTQVLGDGYVFLHPGYFIDNQGDYHVVAYEQVKGDEFIPLAVKKPFFTEDIIGYMNQTIADLDARVGIEVTKEPIKIEAQEGSRNTYVYEYILKSGSNAGPGIFYAFQSPKTDEWVTIQYPTGNETAELIRKSFSYIEL